MRAADGFLLKPAAVLPDFLRTAGGNFLLPQFFGKLAACPDLVPLSLLRIFEVRLRLRIEIGSWRSNAGNTCLQ